MYEITFTLSAVLVFIILDMYYAKVSKVLFKFKKLDAEQLKTLGFILLSNEKDLLYNTYKYRYKDTVFMVKKNKFAVTDLGSIIVMKNNVPICLYKSLTLNFKTGLYANYLKVIYPKTFGRTIRFQSKSNKVSENLKRFMEKEGLLKYK